MGARKQSSVDPVSLDLFITNSRLFECTSQWSRRTTIADLSLGNNMYFHLLNIVMHESSGQQGKD